MILLIVISASSSQPGVVGFRDLFWLTPHGLLINCLETALNIFKGAIALREANEVKKCQPLAPTREVLSLRVYTARRKMARLRQSACLLYQSEPLIYIIRRVEAEVENGRLAIRPDKKLHADLGIVNNFFYKIPFFLM